MKSKEQIQWDSVVGIRLLLFDSENLFIELAHII